MSNFRRQKRFVRPSGRRLAIEVLEDRRLLAASVDPFCMHGLTAEYFSSPDLAAANRLVTRTDPTINFDWGNGAPDPALSSGDNFSVRWTGRIEPRYSETCVFYATVGLDEGVRLWVDGVLLIDAWSNPTGLEQSGSIGLVAGQAYDLKVEYKEATGTASLVVKWLSASSLKEILPNESLWPAQPFDTTGGVLREYWTGLAGGQVSNLTAAVAYERNRPDGAGLLEGLDLGVGSGPGSGEDYGQRLRGYLTTPQTGIYTFRVAGDEAVQLWISQDVMPENTHKIAWADAATNYQEWTRYATQVSAPVSLVAGQQYYVEVLHKEGSGADHVSVAWTLPGQSADQWTIVPAAALSPVRPQVGLMAETSEMNESDPTRPAQYSVQRSDDFGRDQVVYYTLGGTATNGVDYQALSGAVTIPKGQASAGIVVTPIADAIAEGPETLLVRLTPSDTLAYTLGPESTLAASGRIAGELPAASGAALLPGNPLLLANIDTRAGTGTYGSFQNATVSDPGLPFTDVLRVTTTSVPPNYWDIRPLWKSRSAVQQGDTLFASVWLRNAAGAPTNAIANLTFEVAASPWTKSVSYRVTVGSAWTLVQVPFSALGTYAAQSAQFFISLGFQQQTIEIGGLSLVNYGSAVSVASLPRTLQSYGGREAEASWRATAEDLIRQHRMDDLRVVVQDAAGNPVDGALVEVELQQHAYGFGSEITHTLISPTATGTRWDDPDARRYRALIESLFSRVVVGNGHKWPAWEQDPRYARETTDWVNSTGIDLRGHTLVWGRITLGGSGYLIPGWVKETYDGLLAQQGSVAAVAWLKQTVLDHVRDEAAAFATPIPGTTEPPLIEWDVVNEATYGNNDLWSITGQDFLVDVFQTARQYAHADTKLWYNDFTALTGGFSSDAMFNLVQYLQTHGAPLNGVGLQSHFSSASLPSVDFMQSEVNRFVGLGLTVESTEFDVDNLSIDDQQQADFTRDFLTFFFSQPQSSAVVMWGFWQGAHWRADEGAAMFDLDWTVRPLGQAWLDQVQREWATHITGTTRTDGGYATHGYHGKYQVTAQAGNLRGQTEAELVDGGSTIIVRLSQPPAGVQHSGLVVAEHGSAALSVATLLSFDPDW